MRCAGLEPGVYHEWPFPRTVSSLGLCQNGELIVACGMDIVILDPVSGKTMAYNLFVPAGSKPDQKVPLLMFIGDASTVGTDLLRPLKQGYSPAPGFIRRGAFGFRSVGH